MTIESGYILAFAFLLAAGLVGAVVLPAAPVSDLNGSAPNLWFRA